MFELIKLPYSYDALEPIIDKETVEIHYSKHHQAYVNNLNNLLKDTGFENESIEFILQNLDKMPEDKKAGINNNAGGVYNHNLFWTSMIKGGIAPSKNLLEIFEKSFGSFEAFKEEFNNKGLKQFGSGWVFLVEKDNKLEIISMPNQNSPISMGYNVILGNDVWEHAYYLKYQNKRLDYLQAWWNVVNFDEVERRIKN